MSYRIEDIRLYVRETLPGRMLFTLGKHGASDKPARPLTSPIGYVRLTLRGADGGKAFGCAADRLSVRWLDKRPGRSHGRKLHELVALIHHARDVYLSRSAFDSPFQVWQDGFNDVMAHGRSQGQEDLTCCLASAIVERAILDAVARLAGKPLFDMVREDRLGFRPTQVHPELKGLRLADHLPRRPLTRFRIRHTVGLADPLTAGDLPAGQRVNDGLPETLEEYVRQDGLTAFKVKISGDPGPDLDRLGRLWMVIPQKPETIITLDANEAYRELAPFVDFVATLRDQLPGLFERILYIEQPLERTLSLDPSSERWVRRVAGTKPLIIDEADGNLEAFKRAHAIGYAGTSCKNCKGFFKSLLNRALVAHYNAAGQKTFLTGEDLQNLPIVPLHQDFVALSMLGITHCERNGHHYNYGLSMVPEKEKACVAKHHRDLYVQRGSEWFLNIRDGMVACGSLQCPGFGVREEPDWASMTEMRRWVQGRYPTDGPTDAGRKHH